jgi:hypothetical protein
VAVGRRSPATRSRLPVLIGNAFSDAFEHIAHVAEFVTLRAVHLVVVPLVVIAESVAGDFAGVTLGSGHTSQRTDIAASCLLVSVGMGWGRSCPAVPLVAALGAVV